MQHEKERQQQYTQAREADVVKASLVEGVCVYMYMRLFITPFIKVALVEGCLCLWLYIHVCA